MQSQKLRVFGGVRFTTEAPLVRYEPDDWVLEITGQIVGDVENDASEIIAASEEIGTLAALFVMATQAMNDGMRLEDVCDAHSELLNEVHSAIFESGYDTKEGLAIEPGGEGILYIAEVAVKDEFRESGVVTRAIESLIRSFAPAGIIVADRDELSLKVEEWKQLGFKNIAGTRFAFRDNCCINPYGMSVPEDD